MTQHIKQHMDNSIHIYVDSNMLANGGLMEYTRLSQENIKEKIGKRIYITFMCRDVEIKTQKDGKTEYMNMSIQDRDNIETGVKLFQLNEYHRTMIIPGCVYSAAIDVQRYEYSKNGYSLVIYNIGMVSEDGNEYFDWDSRTNICAEYIKNRIDRISDATYRDITRAIINGNWNKFVMYPAANSIHHSQLGGLCVHTYEVMKYAENMANTIIEINNMDIDIDLLVAACALHDIGKIKEFSVDSRSGKSEYSPSAALITHVITAVEVIIAAENKLIADRGGLTEEDCHKIELLKHCILAHHGKLEYGSPIEPSIPEAYIISKADGMSADVYRFEQAYKEMDRKTSKTTWNSGKIEKYYKK